MFIIVMGVSGSGKTTIARMLAKRLGWRFYEGDTFHPPANIAKMSAGVPLNDEDRLGWLDALANLIENESRAGENGVIACSALKKAYRDVLRRHDRKQIEFVYLRGSFDVIYERMKRRGEHFMKPEMLQSQFAILEEPQGIITVDVTLSPDEIVQNIMEQLSGSFAKNLSSTDDTKPNPLGFAASPFPAWPYGRPWPHREGGQEGDRSDRE